MDIKKLKYKIVVDSRERCIKHILSRFDEGFENKPSHHDMYRGKNSTYTEPIPYYIQEKGLKVGDYTIAIQLPNKEILDFKDKIVVERKADLSELASNFYSEKDESGMSRLEREFKRGYEQGIKIHLVIETSDAISKILSSKHFRYDKASKVNPKSFQAMLITLANRYDISVWYCDKKDSGRLIHDLLYYYCRNYLDNMEV